MKKTTYTSDGEAIVTDSDDPRTLTASEARIAAAEDAANSQPGNRDPAFPSKHPMPQIPAAGVPLDAPLPAPPPPLSGGKRQQGPTPSPSTVYPGDKRRAQAPDPHPLRRAGDPYAYTAKYPGRVISQDEQARFTAHEQRVAEATQAANKGGSPESAPRTKAEQDLIP